MTTAWRCPKCHRTFVRKNQQHSCTVFPLRQHFENKQDVAKPLFNKLLRLFRTRIGPCSVVSLPCCIHLSHRGRDFAAVYALKDGLRFHVGASVQLKSRRITQVAKVSAHRYMHSLDVHTAQELDAELMHWLKRSYAL
ncbi:MAG: DUF5655 domain-containing protein [Candidatus Kerfeldbacteria bacterium]